MERLFIEEGGLKIEIQVVRRRKVFGRDERLITPVAGGQSKWVRLERIIRENG